MTSGATGQELPFGGLIKTSNPQYLSRKIDFCGWNRYISTEANDLLAEETSTGH